MKNNFKWHKEQIKYNYRQFLEGRQPNKAMPYSPEVMTEKLNGIFSPYTKYIV